jgi:hypothetical protein
MEVLEPNEGLLPRERDRGEVEDISKEVGIGMGSELFAVFGVVVAGDITGSGKTLRRRVAGWEGTNEKPGFFQEGGGEGGKLSVVMV